MVLAEIRSLAVQLADEPERDQAASFLIDHETNVFLPAERPFWMPPSEFAAVDLKPHTANEVDRTQAFTNLALLRSLDWRRLRRRIGVAVAPKGVVTLAALLTTDELSHDAVEVMGLIQIAHEDGHLVDDGSTEVIHVCHADGVIAELEIPNVVFSRDRTGSPPTDPGRAATDPGSAPTDPGNTPIS